MSVQHSTISSECAYFIICCLCCLCWIGVGNVNRFATSRRMNECENENERMCSNMFGDGERPANGPNAVKMTNLIFDDIRLWWLKWSHPLTVCSFTDKRTVGPVCVCHVYSLREIAKLFLFIDDREPKGINNNKKLAHHWSLPLFFAFIVVDFVHFFLVFRFRLFSVSNAAFYSASIDAWLRHIFYVLFAVCSNNDGGYEFSMDFFRFGRTVCSNRSFCCCLVTYLRISACLIYSYFSCE